ncbi:MAG: hypothetical protein NT028_03510 [candidate division Zixibacteria bacterium]|nr:hypothetical protein [candidate division Zixibacteria bacterium]
MNRKIIIAFGLVAFAGVGARAEIMLPPTQLSPAMIAQSEPQKPPSSGFSEVQQGKERTFKNPWRAFLMSAVLPGAGERYAGAGLKSKVFFVSEVGLWSALISFRHLGNWRKDEYRLQAATAASADVAGKDDRYFDVLGFYDSREDYNKVAGAYDHTRVYYPDTESYFWKWESTDARIKYRDLKNDSKSYYRKANFSLGLILANHLISAADAYWSAKRFNRHVESGFSGVDLQLLPQGGWQVSLSARF